MNIRSTDVRDALIWHYHHQGCTNKETLKVLEQDGYAISYRHLKRIKTKLELKRRNTNPVTVVAAVQEELKDSGECLGYRAMTQRLRTSRGLNANPHLVRHCLRVLDADGVDARQRRRLRRRQYWSEGPLLCIHLDGYDKLKPFGFAIHGCIDGFSRKILWLQVGRTNNDPNVVAGYFVNWLRHENGTAKRIRMDHGTENITVQDLQKAIVFWITQDEDQANRSVLLGRSTMNQRIERFWGILRKSMVQYWMDLFRAMAHEGVFDKGIPLQIECLRFCFMQLIQKELDRMAQEWNVHAIQGSPNQEGMRQRPAMVYSHPELFGGVSCKISLGQFDIQQCREFTCTMHANGTLEEYANIFQEKMQEMNWTLPQNVYDALTLYGNLVASC